MKEDLLEQIVDHYLKFRGYFTTHNVSFRPRADHPEYVRQDDSVPSDVDVVGFHPSKTGPGRVVVVSCKAWQAGFDASAKLAELRREKANPKRETWRHFREVWVPKWSEAFRTTIEHSPVSATSITASLSLDCAATRTGGSMTRRSPRILLGARSGS
jgi:hypothetical protein